MVVPKVVSPIVVVFPESSFSRNRRRSPGIVVVIPELSYSRTRRRFLRIASLPELSVLPELLFFLSNRLSQAPLLDTFTLTLPISSYSRNLHLLHASPVFSYCHPTPPSHALRLSPLLYGAVYLEFLAKFSNNLPQVPFYLCFRPTF